MKKIYLIITLFVSLDLCAQNQLQIWSPDAKSLGMGGITTTSVADSHAIYDNPAMAAFARNTMQISSSYFSQKSSNYYTVSGYANFDGLNYGFVGWRNLRRVAGLNNDMSLDLGYARKIDERWSMAVVGHYYRFKRPDIKYDALALDLSVGYTIPIENVGEFASMRFGAKVSDIGGYLNNDAPRLPASVKSGAAFDVFITDAHQLTAALDLGGYFGPSYMKGFEMSIGAEYNFMQLLQLRAGYHYGDEDSFYPSYGSIGAGVRFLHLRLDAAYIFAGKNSIMRNAYSISFGLDF